MGGILACICCYCCLMTLKPRVIEVIALIANLIEIGFLIWGIAGIPWDDISTGGKILFYAACAVVVLTFFITLILMCLRCGNKINTTKNSTGKCICITGIVLDIIGEILIIIAEIVILYKMYDKDDEYYYGDDGYYNDRYRRRRRWDSLYSDSEWAAAIVPPSAAEIGLGIHLYCLSFLLKLIYFKTNKSYLRYKETEENPNDIFSRTINAMNSPPEITNNQLNFLGYDQNGHPIYSGNTQYFTQNQPPANNNPQTVVIKNGGDKK